MQLKEGRVKQSIRDVQLSSLKSRRFRVRFRNDFAGNPSHPLM